MTFLRPQFIVALVVVAAASFLLAAAPPKAKVSDQVMPAKRRTQIVATAKSLFEPEVKNSVKVGKVKSPFSAGGN